jgi:hypothetical protein
MISELDRAAVTISMQLIGHLAEADINTVLDRIAAITRARFAAFRDKARADASLMLLAEATGWCPADDDIISWLAKRGLIEKRANGSWRIR